MISTRFPKDIVAAIETWATKNEIGRSEAIRRLVELGLAGKTKRKPPRDALVADLAAETIDPLPRSAPAVRAKELAKDAIDKMTDATAPPEEHAQRRRHLTKGPAEFRAARIDQPNKGAKGK
jgi:hypothetical protein